MNIAAKVISGYYLIINVALLITMAIDKMWSIKHKWRVPESTLFIMALLGGAIGGFCGMFLCHHKTKKSQFYIIYATAFVLHFTLVYFIFTKIIRL